MNAARQSGLRRFIFISSIGVCGVLSNDSAFAPDTPAAPEEPYQIAKFEAETALSQLAQESGIELIILRPPFYIGGA